jgi:hypothetical protein
MADECAVTTRYATSLSSQRMGRIFFSLECRTGRLDWDSSKYTYRLCCLSNLYT